MAPNEITVTRAALTDDVSRALITELNAELTKAYATEAPGANHFRLEPAEVEGTRGAFLIVHLDGTAVGCGAVRLLDAEVGELKRMFIAPTARGRGLGRRLLQGLEAEARRLGARRLILETGIHQTAALALYQCAGFHPIPLYGEYLLSPATSRCFGKELS